MDEELKNEDVEEQLILGLKNSNPSHDEEIKIDGNNRAKSQSGENNKPTYEIDLRKDGDFDE